MRFFASPENIDLTAKSIKIFRDNKHFKALRLRVGDVITVADGRGADYDAVIDSYAKDYVALRIINSCESAAEPKVKVTLFQAPPKYGRLETAIEKCVELGVYEIVPLITEYTQPRVNSAEKIERLNKVALAAAKQSNRAIAPRVLPPIDFKAATDRAKEFALAIAACERGGTASVKDVLAGFCGGSIGVYIGPEGGFTADEVSLFIDKSIHTISLGARILRTETASIVCLAVLLYELGEY